MRQVTVGLVARREFIGDGGRRYKPGDPCDEALRWRFPALRACINQGLIEDTTGEVSKHFGLPDRAALAQARGDRRQQLTLVPTEPLESDEVDLEQAKADPIDEDTPEYEEEPEDLKLDAQISCDTCAALFPSKTQLKKHRAKAHRE